MMYKNDTNMTCFLTVKSETEQDYRRVEDNNIIFHSVGKLHKGVTTIKIPPYKSIIFDDEVTIISIQF